jgi:hypothetical protein
MKKILYTIVFLITIATYSQEEKTDWILIEESEAKIAYYKVRSKNTAWFKIDFKNDGRIYEEKVIRQSLMLVKFNCDSGLYGYLKTVFYDDDLEIIVNESFNELFVKMDYVIPESIMEGYYNVFCNKGKKD